MVPSCQEGFNALEHCVAPLLPRTREALGRHMFTGSRGRVNHRGSRAPGGGGAVSKKMGVRLLLKDPRGGGVVWGPGQPRPTHPPTHIRTIYLGLK